MNGRTFLISCTVRVMTILISHLSKLAFRSAQFDFEWNILVLCAAFLLSKTFINDHTFVELKLSLNTDS